MRFGVIGFGLRSGLAVSAHQPDKGWEVAALADPSEAAQARFREKVGPDAKTVADFRDLLALDLDAVFVLSPDWLHEEQAVACLEAGKAVYLEKPMAITIEGCDRILAAAERSGAKLYVGHNMRWFGVVRKMKEWIDAGAIGNVKACWTRHFVNYGGDAYFRDWHADRSKSTGLLLQKASHDLDVMHWLCGGYTKRVTAMGKLMVYGDLPRAEPGEHVPVQFRSVWPPTKLDKLNPVVDVEDLSMMLMELDNGVLASYQQCHFSPDGWRNYTVIGDRGRIENFGDGPGSSVVRLWESYKPGSPKDGDLEYRQPAATGGHGGSDELILEEFVRYVQGGGDTVNTPLAARMAVAAGVCATESLRNGSVPIDIPPVG